MGPKVREELSKELGSKPALRKETRDNTFFQNKNLIDNGAGILVPVERRDTARFGEHHDGVKDVVAQKALTRNSFNNGRQSHRSSVSSRSSANEAEAEEVLEIYKGWRKKKVEGGSKRIFIRDCRLSALNIEISFLARKSMNKMGGKSAQSQIHSNLNSWGLTLINIDEVPVRVS